MSPLNVAYAQLAISTTSSGENDTLAPGKEFTLGVTVSNASDEQSLDVTVELRDLPEDLAGKLQPVRLALFPQQREQIFFKIQAPETALPRLVPYTLAVTDSSVTNGPGDREKLLERQQLSLHILPVNRAETSIEKPTFYLEPATSSTAPQKIQPLAGVPIQVWVDNRSELVDLFRLQCDGLPKDWEVTITYPQDSQGLGLRKAAHFIRLNPGDRGQVLLMIKPPADAKAGVYVPTLQLISEKNPELKLLHLAYLEVSPIFLLQPSLQALRSQFQKGSALFELQLKNSGNSSRHIEIELESLDESDRYEYDLQETSVQIFPQATTNVTLEVVPKKKWKRPLYGAGHFSNFRFKLTDKENHPLPVETLQGNITWQARPWWQLLLCVLVALGLAGGTVGILWWVFLRPPTPAKIHFIEGTQPNYSAEDGQSAKLDFLVELPKNLKSLEITGYDPEGNKITTPIPYDFPEGEVTSEDLPHGLKTDANCSVQTQKRLFSRKNLLACSGVHTGAYLPNEYIFQLDVTSESKGELVTVSEQSKPVTIAPIPSPEITVFRALQSAYNERPGSTSTVLLDKNVQLALEVLNPQSLESIKLVAKNKDGEVVGDEEVHPIWSADEQNLLNPKEDGRNSCQLLDDGERLRCPGLSTKALSKLQQTGVFQIEATLIPQQPTPEENLVKVVTEPITVHPAPLSISTFTIDDKTPLAQHIVPIDPATFNLEAPLRILFGWNVSGGVSTQVEILTPNPQTAPREGEVYITMTPGERKTISIQVADGAGNKIMRSVEIVAVNPNPVSPVDMAEAIAKGLQENEAAQSEAQTNSSASPIGTPSTVDIDRVSPSELNPQVNR